MSGNLYLMHGRVPRHGGHTMMGAKAPAILRYDPRKMSDFEAGIHFLSTVAWMYPGITFGEFFKLAQDPNTAVVMGKKCRGFGCIGSFFSDSTKWIGRNVSDAVGLFARKGGEAVRLLTDEKVINGASKIGSMYANGGGGAASNGFLSRVFGQSGAQSIDDFMKKIGGLWKGGSGGGGAQQSAAPGAISPALMLGVGGLITFGLVVSRRR